MHACMHACMLCAPCADRWCRFFPVRTKTKINPWIVLNSLSIDSIRSRRKIEMSLLWLRAGRICARERARARARARGGWSFVSAFDPFYLDHSRPLVADPRHVMRGEGRNVEQTSAGAYPVRWPIQGCKICIYGPEWASKITKFYRRFSWFWIILHSPPWPPSTPSRYIPWTFQRDRKGPLSLARRAIMVRPFLFYPRKFPGPVRRDKGFRVVFWRMGERAEAHKGFIRGSIDRSILKKWNTQQCSLRAFQFLNEERKVDNLNFVDRVVK